MYKEFEISEDVINTSNIVLNKIKDQFEHIEKMAEYNQLKVLSAFRKNKIAEAHFYGTTGYGYNDLGREAIEKVYADIFGVEDALVRVQFVSGTHAISTCLFGILRPGDTLLAISGEPYDTLGNTIRGEGMGSLKDFGVNYKAIDLDEEFNIKLDEVLDYISKNNVKMIEIQRSKGYGWRKTFSAEYINSVIKEIHSSFPDVVCFVDNCYGEFVDEVEPYEADLIAGSLIKNLGAGIAPNGAYVVGKTKYVDLVAQRLTCPGIGKECGATLGFNKLVLQGLFLAPHVVAQALKTSIFCAGLLEEYGFTAEPASNEIRHDIIQSVKIGDKDKLIKFCQGLQSASPIDSYVVPVPWAMPGYKDEVIMAAGTFNQGSSIELSADAPIREPYIVYMQGGLTFESGKIGIMKAVSDMLK